MKRKYKLNNGQLKAFRKQLNCNQTDFWNAVGLTQSAGSRYEAGTRSLPAIVVAEIIRVHIDNYPPVGLLLKDAFPAFRRQLRDSAKWGRRWGK